MKKILITVSGDRQVGKTTMAKILGKFLNMVGCQITYEDVNPDMTRELNKIDPVIINCDPWDVTIRST